MSWLRKLLRVGAKVRLVGVDLKGNQYFEQIVEGGRRPKRHVRVRECQDLVDYTPETIPPEWDRWLRGGADEPPSAEEQNLRLQQQEGLKHKVANVERKDTERRDKEIDEGLVAGQKLSATKAVDHASSPSYKPDTSEQPTSTGKDFVPGSWKP